MKMLSWQGGIKKYMRRLTYAIAVMFLANKTFAYPVIIEAKRIPSLLGAIRNRLVAFSIEKDGSPTINRIQVEEVENGAALIFRKPTFELPQRKTLSAPQPTDPFKGRLVGAAIGDDSIHRVILDDGDFKECGTVCQRNARAAASRVCGFKNGNDLNLVQIELEWKKTTSFIVECRKSNNRQWKNNSKIDLKTRKITSEQIEYRYISDTNILLDSLSVGGHQILKQNEMVLSLNSRWPLIPNISFTHKDLISKITSYTKNPLSIGVEFSVAAQFLGFIKVNEQICCDLSIFKDAIYLPLMLSMPSDGSSFKPGSGLFYGLNYNGESHQDVEYLLPRLKENGRAQPSSEGAAVLIRKSGRIIGIGLGQTRKDAPIPSMVYRQDLAKYGFPKINSQAGIFYDATTMKKGDQNIRFWFYFGDEKDRNTILEYSRNGIRFMVKEVGPI